MSVKSSIKSNAVQRQISLPTSKAIEIAYKSIRLRLTRSLLVTSGIVLALAFLISIQTSDAILNGMREWVRTSEASPRFQLLRSQSAQLDDSLRPIETSLRDRIAHAPRPAKDAAAFNASSHFGSTFESQKKELGELPAPPADLSRAMLADNEAINQFEQWLKLARERHALKYELTAPQRLEAEMKAHGVPISETEIASARLQTRWLLGLALLVAFVGILNAMLMSVTERFREIGTMKCLGALDSFIIKLFLIESLFQGCVGTIIGLVVGLSLSLLAAASSYGSYAWKNLPYNQLGIAIVVCLAVGMTLTVAGAIYPAWQAAKMQPIEAMRATT